VTTKEKTQTSNKEPTPSPPSVEDDMTVPISPPSNEEALRERVELAESIQYSYYDDPEEGVLFEETSQEIK
jgi:hypothetical protein